MALRPNPVPVPNQIPGPSWDDIVQEIISKDDRYLDDLEMVVITLLPDILASSGQVSRIYFLFLLLLSLQSVLTPSHRARPMMNMSRRLLHHRLPEPQSPQHQHLDMISYQGSALAAPHGI